MTIPYSKSAAMGGLMSGYKMNFLGKRKHILTFPFIAFAVVVPKDQVSNNKKERRKGHLCVITCQENI